MPKSPGRRKTPPRRAASGTRKRRRAPAARWSRVLSVARTLLQGLAQVRHLLPALPLLAVVLAVFVLDPAAVAHLAWLCTTGTFGLLVQLGVAALLLACVALTTWAFWPEPAPGPRRRVSGRVTERRASREEPAADNTAHRTAHPTAHPMAHGASGRKRRAADRSEARPSPDAAGPSPQDAAQPAPQDATGNAATPAKAAAPPPASRANGQGGDAPAPRRAATRRGKPRIRQGNETLAGADGQR